MESSSKNGYECTGVDFKVPRPLSLKPPYSEKSGVLASVTNNSGNDYGRVGKEKYTPTIRLGLVQPRNAAKTPSMASSLRPSDGSSSIEHGPEWYRKSSSISTGSRRTLFGSHTSSIRSNRSQSALTPSFMYTTPKTSNQNAPDDQLCMTTPGCASGNKIEVPITPALTSSTAVQKVSRTSTVTTDSRTGADDAKLSQGRGYTQPSPSRMFPQEQMLRIRQMLVKFRSNLIFLDGMDRDQKSALQKRVVKWGARTADFLQKDVTLIVTTGREDSGLAAVYCSKEMFASKPQLSFTEHLRAALQLRCERSIKVWELHKLEKLFGFFEEYKRASDAAAQTGSKSNSQTQSQAQEADLVQLLTQEKLAGLPTTTTHRSKAAHADWYEFQYPYILVEDALNNHKPIVVREFDYRSKFGDACLNIDSPEPRPTPWPRLYFDSPAERCPYHAFYAKSGDSKKSQPRQLRAANAADTDAASGITLRDTNASGLHTLSTAQSTTARHQRWSQMKRRKETAFHNVKMLSIGPDPKAAARGRAQTRQSTAALSKTALGLEQLHEFEVLAESQDENMLASEKNEILSKLTGSAEERDALRMRALIVYQKPGWCENCSEKYTHFTEHVKSKQHRAYAASRANFVHLDNVLRPLARPTAPKSADTPQFDVNDIEIDMLAQQNIAYYDNTSGNTDKELEWVWVQHKKACAKDTEIPSATSLSLPSDELDEQLVAAAIQTAFDSDFSEELTADVATPTTKPSLKRRAPHSECGQESNISNELSDEEWAAVDGHTNSHLIERVKRMKRMSSGHQKNHEVSATVS